MAILYGNMAILFACYLFDSLKETKRFGHIRDRNMCKCGQKGLIGPEFPKAQNRMFSTKNFLRSHL